MLPLTKTKHSTKAATTLPERCHLLRPGIISLGGRTSMDASTQYGLNVFAYQTRDIPCQVQICGFACPAKLILWSEQTLWGQTSNMLCLYSGP